MSDAFQAFRDKHDKRISIPKKINDALVRLGDGEKWMYDSKFAIFAGVSTQDLGEARPAFEQFIVTVSENGKPKRVWCCTAAFAEELRTIPGVR